eukprot:TRINITY_DN2651_c1_g1_i1.p1 TRINITY_DN2651_c1_g1~~TRINITY_DN2651_c1_g1_i1.p1  ORF type:complete len:162 (+),score=38.72 TRINITY_DN2651_c1_g1_i1:72-557(+)
MKITKMKIEELSYLEKLPYQLLSTFGQYLELKEINRLMRTSKTMLEKINRDNIFYNYSKERMKIEKLNDKYETWKEFVKNYFSLKWEIVSKILVLTENKRGITSKSGSWGCALTNISFKKGRHFVSIKLNVIVLGFFGIALKDTPLDSPCFVSILLLFSFQ